MAITNDGTATTTTMTTGSSLALLTPISSPCLNGRCRSQSSSSPRPQLHPAYVLVSIECPSAAYNLCQGHMLGLDYVPRHMAPWVAADGKALDFGLGLGETL
uniref:Uncharacterized protein n=1 Tax=Nelumbo nucifera TaxID=4432 RepID=A0A822XTM0_NELNU|nr:TPA_asm: hypothetical protein HUJ06_022251 [Nelumbo nucifera]